MSKYLGAIVYINLLRRPDRRQNIENELQSIGVKAPVIEIFRAIDYPEVGIYGCSESHLAVLRLAKERKYPNILIMEDDFKFLVNAETFESQLEHLFSRPDGFDVCMLAYNMIKKEPCPGDPLMMYARDVQTASGYIVNQRMYDPLISTYEIANPLLLKTRRHWLYANDQSWKHLQGNGNWLAFVNATGEQRDPTDSNT